MTRYFLTRLKVEGFRGINNHGTPLEMKFKSDHVNSVFATNASGKSSLFEALTYAIKGEIPKLAELQASDNADRYYVNRFHGAGRASIEVDFTSDDTPSSVDTVLVELDGTTGIRSVTSPSGHADPAQLLVALDQAFTLLDYASFQRFIDDTPLRRGRSFASLLGLAEYSEYRQALRVLSDTRSVRNDLGMPALEATASAASRAMPTVVARLHAAFTELTGEQIGDSHDLTALGTGISSVLTAIPLVSSFFEGVSIKDVDFASVATSLESAEGGDERARLLEINRVVEDLEKLVLVSAVNEERLVLVNGVRELTEQLATTQGEHYQHLFAAVQKIIDGGELENPHICPVCGSLIERTIGDLVEEQLDQYATVAERTRELDDIWSASTSASLLAQIEQSPHIGLESSERIAHAFQETVRMGTVVVTDVDSCFDRLQLLGTLVAGKMASLVSEREQIEASLPPSLVALSRRVDAARRFRDAWEEYDQHEVEYEVADGKRKARQAWIDFISQASKTFADAETRMTSAKVAEIGSAYKSMFASIMNTQAIVPELRRPSSGEELRVELEVFHGLHDVSARAVLSESYRNALAISVFLSAAKRHKSSPRFVVLDDVTSSFDAGHQYFLMEHIRSSLQARSGADGLQFIILSHDGQLEKYFDKLGNTLGWHHQRLNGSPPVGAVVTHAQGASRLEDTARDFLNAGQAQQAEPLIRQHLEFKLTEIIRKLDIPVPIDYAMKDQSRMVSNSIAAIQAAIDLHKAAGMLVLAQSQEADFGAHHVTGIISNWVSHYETGTAGSLSAAVLLRVLDDTNRLSECFQYDDTRNGVTAKKWYRSLRSR
ncbi:DUF2813 domain-containing protein [Cryobacterium sp. TmT2-59]|uniref:AAA family ATPase n=1 Tax=Cryobacterium sp. TmT2-59 TaxID=1259264 RepID=UPI001069B780|nr:AAA family ATPase [Cryobacterium sp. TmT2-59]TFC82134.1 DUF2813 domain-containing protein [Cryobacterium sp. TmT2-59]